MITSFFVLLGVYVLLNIADIITTVYALRLGAAEQNPVAVYTMDKLGIWKGLITMKVVAVTPFFLVAPSQIIMIALTILVFVYAAVVANNLNVIGSIQ